MKNKKAENLSLIPICIAIALMLFFLFMYVFKADGQEKVYLVGASHGWSYPEYITSSDTAVIDSFISHHLKVETNAIEICNIEKSYVYIETQKTSLYLVSGIIRKKKNGKEKFIAMVPARGVRRDVVERKNKKR